MAITMTVDFMSSVKEREKIVDEVRRKLKDLDCDFLIAAQDRDVALASMVSFEAKLPLTYLDQKTQELSLTERMWGQNGVIVADHIESGRSVEPTLLKVKA